MKNKYLENMKYFLSSKESKKQLAFIEKCGEILQHIPSQFFKDEFTNIIYNLDFEGNDLDNLIMETEYHWILIRI